MFGLGLWGDQAHCLGIPSAPWVVVISENGGLQTALPGPKGKEHSDILEVGGSPCTIPRGIWLNPKQII